MILLNLPAELLLRIIHHIPTIRDKCELLKTCTHLNQLLGTHVACWSNLDLSPYNAITNSTLLTFLKNCSIPLYTTSSNSNNTSLNSISRLDLSGCWCLSQDMVVALSKSFPNLNELFLNGYRLNTPPQEQKRVNSLAFEQQRDHLYQVRPSHDLSSMSMDLSKKSTNRLKIPYILLANILCQVPHITSLSIQYQDLSPSITTNRPYFSEFSHIRYLDISSCTVNQPGLQTMLRKMGTHLISLKMLNIDLNNLTWLCLSQYGKNISCLHISCNEPMFLPCIRRTVSNLKYLQDFRLTRIRTGTIDPVIEKLNPLLLKRLDVSPKMNIYPRSIPANDTPATARQRVRLSSSSSSASRTMTRKHPPQPLLTISSYATTEHDLLISDISLHHLSRCHQLVELRLCFPTINSSWSCQLFQAIPQLEIFELRQQQQQQADNKKQQQAQPQQEDYLRGLKYLRNLKQVYLYSVYISKEAIQTLSELKALRHITITHGGKFIGTKESQSLLLRNCNVLNSVYLGQLTQPVTSKSTWPDIVVNNNIMDNSSNISFYNSNNKVWSVQ